MCFLHSHVYVIPVFTWILTLAILLAHKIIQPITSLLTLLKGILLIVTVTIILFYFTTVLVFVFSLVIICHPQYFQSGRRIT